ncbi:hypothetical protein AB0D49_06970 [Streptomyces sp. NPDC048290]|uniref:hypothetical protein n=1 Tax=Streptomyces sp. NPDC048290 TaxID=3155811 RepID=UPI00343702F8
MRKAARNERERLPHWLRGLILLMVACGALLCGLRAADGYGAAMAHHDAPVCAAGDDGGTCVRREQGTVVDRRTGQDCSGEDGTCTTYYEVSVRWPDRTAWLEVGSGMYAEVRTDDRAEVGLWRDEVVELEVRDRTRSYATSAQDGVLWWLALGSLLLAVGAWAVLSGRPATLLHLSVLGWPLAAVGLGWLGSMALFGGHPALWAFAIVWTGFAILWSVGARRVR